MNPPVGYKRPPRHTRFRPGESGNPGGRPKRMASFQDDLQSELAEPLTIKDAGKELVVSKQRAIARALVQAALKGDARAWSAVISLTQRESSNRDGSSAADDALVEEFIKREVKRRIEGP